MKEVLIKHTSLTTKEVLYLSLLTVTCCGIVAHSLRGDVEPVLVSVAFSGIAFAFTYSLIQWLGKAFMKVGLKGRDMSKLRKEEMYVQSHPGSTFSGNQTLNADLGIQKVLRRWVPFAQ